MSPTRVWRTAGGDGSRRGLLAQALEVKERPQRQLPVEGAVQASAVFDDQGRAFIADMSGAVQAFSAAGEVLWRTALEGGISATPAVHPSKPLLFVGTHTGAVHALAADSGASLWRKELPTQADPRILSDLLCLPEPEVVILSSWGGRFHALDASSGIERFSWDAGISPASAAAAGRDGIIYCLRAVADKGVEFVRVDSAGRETVLHHAKEEQRGARRTLVSAPPVLDEERAAAYLILNGDQGGQLLGWSLKTSSVLWTQPLAQAVQATPAISKDGVIITADLAGTVRGIGPEGKPRFQYGSGCEYLLSGAVVDAAGTVLIGDPLGKLHRIDSSGAGQTIFEAERSIQARPSVDPDGRVYVPSTGRKVYVFDGGKRAGAKPG